MVKYDILNLPIKESFDCYGYKFEKNDNDIENLTHTAHYKSDKEPSSIMYNDATIIRDICLLFSFLFNQQVTTPDNYFLLKIDSGGYDIKCIDELDYNEDKIPEITGIVEDILENKLTKEFCDKWKLPETLSFYLSSNMHAILEEKYILKFIAFERLFTLYSKKEKSLSENQKATKFVKHHNFLENIDDEKMKKFINNLFNTRNSIAHAGKLHSKNIKNLPDKWDKTKYVLSQYYAISELIKLFFVDIFEIKYLIEEKREKLTAEKRQKVKKPCSYIENIQADFFFSYKVNIEECKNEIINFIKNNKYKKFNFNKDKKEKF